jgi:hypothetical protein
MRRNVRAAAALLALAAGLCNPAPAEELTIATPDGARNAIRPHVPAPPPSSCCTGR